MSCSVSNITKVGGVNRNAALGVHSFPFITSRIAYVTIKITRETTNTMLIIFPISPCKCVCIALEI